MKYIIHLIPVLLIFLTGCTGQAQPNTLTVFAAASLTEAFTEMAEAFEAQYPDTDVILNFAGAQTLRLQIEQGARADVFASANQLHADALLEAGLIEPPAIFTHNQLAVIVPAANPAGINTLADLAQPGSKLVLAGPTVPAGRYARQALEKLNNDPALGHDFSERVLQNLVSEEDTVKGVAAKVQLGEADAGIVYVSDITPAVKDKVIILPIPEPYNVIADYPLARVTGTEMPDLARTFIEFVLSTPGQMILETHGFQPVAPPVGAQTK